MYVVLGASGNTGRGVAEALLASGAAVRVVGRSQERLQDLVAKGAEPFEGSVENVSAMREAFAGAKALYSLIPPDLAAPDFRAYQRRVSEATAGALADAGVGHVVTLSSVGAELAEGCGPVSGLHVHEQALNAVAGLNTLHLRAGFFMENFFSSIDLIKNMGTAGSTLRADLSVPAIATADIAAYAARRLLALDFTGASTRDLLGQRDLTMAEATSVLGAAIGKPDLAYTQFPYADAEQNMVAGGMSANVAALFTEMTRALNEDRMKATEARAPENTTPTSIEEFAPVFAAVYNQQA